MNGFMSIERQIVAFLNDVTQQEHVDLIVCSERKATAMLRAVINEISKSDRFVWDWSKVLSTVAVPQFDWDSFRGSKVLLFDELIHHGKTLKEHETDLRHYLPPNVDIVTAGFAVWDQCEYRPKFSFYSAVDSETYEHIRESIVYMLQKYGSLLLDTEHIELSVRLHCGIREFYDELARASESGKTYSFISGASRTNLTVDQPEIISDATIHHFLTPGSNIDGSVRKVRVLERSHQVFSILPIFYPNVRCVPSTEWVENLPQFIARDRFGKEVCRKEIFYVIGLLCSVELLRGIVISLNDLIRAGKVTLEVPIENFPHLHTMFPRIDVEKLRQYVSDVVADSKTAKVKTKKKSVKAGNVPPDKLLKLSSRVMCSLVEEYDNMLLGTESPKGKSCRELLDIAENQNRDVGLDMGALTVVVDRLIDAGLVVTDVEEVTSSSRDPYCVRTFTPEGEVVSSRIRQQIMVRDPECLLTI
ncbi:MAG: hypothetical protein MUP16_05025 [Sedimentisphaerales bacterium]|nr:hypothetical protein [Sedimentisphaerales bacterium]